MIKSTIARPVSIALFLVVLLGCGARSEPEIVAETYPPEIGPVIPPPNPGAPGGIVWLSEPSIAVPADPAQWNFNTLGIPSANDNQQGSTMIALSPSDGETIACVRVAVAPSAGHQKLPEVLPAVSVWRFDLDTAGPHQIAVASDPSASIAEYEKPHQIEACAGEDGEKADLSRFRYQASVFNEHGFDSLPGLKVLGVRRGIVPSP